MQQPSLRRARGRPTRTAIHARLEREVADLRARFGGLPSPVEADAVWTDIWYAEAHNSTAIEGNTLLLKHVQTLLKEGKAVGDKELREYLEVTGYAEAARWVYGQALSRDRQHEDGLVTLQDIRHIHHVALTPVWQVAPHPNAAPEESPGNWRRHNIRPFVRGMAPPDFTEVPARMRDWVREANAAARAERAIDVVARSHADFERIHPFLDGNGRAGRLLMNLVLVRLAYPPAIVLKNDRTRYLAALAKADRGDIAPLSELIARAVLANLMRFVYPAVAGEARLVPLEALATKDLSLVSLRTAARRGRLRAYLDEAGLWRSSRRWVSEYKRDRYASLRGPRLREHAAKVNPR